MCAMNFIEESDSHTLECHLSATQECNSTLFATSQLSRNVHSKIQCSYQERPGVFFFFSCDCTY